MKIRKPAVPASAPKPRQRQSLLWALMGTASLCSSTAWAAAPLPTEGVVKQGIATISTQAQSVVIQQQSARLLTDWRSFSIGAGHTVRFVQPSSQSIALNRVWGGDASVIAGQLQANGQVVLQNPQGVMFSRGAQVDVGSLVATSLRADASLFMRTGRLHFSGAEPGTGLVVNEGVLRAANGGHVVLAGTQVENRGEIHTPSGQTALLAGDVIKVDPTGSGLLQVSVPVSAINARLAHSGVIEADGGSVTLQAAATDAALRQVMQVDGVVKARGVAQQGGEIWLLGGTSGVNRVGGELDVSSAAGQGGAITVLGERVALTGAARLDASGQTGGGQIRVGGDFHGEPVSASLPNAQSTGVGRAVVLDASAKQQGDGGEVVVWADGSTRFEGQVRAQGGAAQGNGGKAEVSGRQHLQFDGQADLRAPQGRMGSLLLDPATLTIGLVSDLNGDGVPGDDLALATLPVADFPGLNAGITATKVASLLSTSDVSLQAGLSLRVEAPLTVAPGGAATTLTLASPDIQINQRMVLNNAALVASADALSVPSTVDQRIRVNAPIQSLSSVTLVAGDIGLNHLIEAPRVNLISSLNAPLSSPSPIVTQLATAPGLITPFLNIGGTAGSSAQVKLLSSSNHVSALAVVAAEADVAINNPAGERLNLRGDVPRFTLRANTGIIQSNADPAGRLNVSEQFNLRVDSTDPVSGAVELTHPGNTFANISSNLAPVTFDVASSLNLFAANGLSASGTAGRKVTLNSGTGLFVLAADITSGSVAAPSVIDITAAGFRSSSTAGLNVSPGGRFLIRSSDATRDSLNRLGFGTTLDKLNYVVLDGYTGPDPTTGNGLYTNRSGSLTPSAAERSAISRVYDATTAFAYQQTGVSGVFRDDGPAGAAPLPMGSGVSYNIKSTGQFANKNVGSGKAYSVAPSQDVAMQTTSGAVLYGLRFAGFNRAAGAGNPISQVTAQTLTTSGVRAVDRAYDGTTSVALDVSGVVLNGINPGDVVTASTSAVGTMVNKNVGNLKPVTVTGLSLTGADAGNYALLDASTPRVNITPLALSGSGINALDRVYDGTSTVSLDLSAARLNILGSPTRGGVLPGDVVTLLGSAAVGQMANKNVGSAKPVTVTGLTISGADAPNYTLSSTYSTTVNITPRSLISSGITALDRVYDGSTQVSLNLGTAAFTHLIAGDAVMLSTAAVARVSDKSVGSAKPVTVTGLTISGVDAANYTLSDVSRPTVNITPRNVISSGITAVDRIYDGSLGVSLNAAVASLSNTVAGDRLALNAASATATMAYKNVGSGKPVTISGLALTGADAANYTLRDTSKPTVNITPLGVAPSGIKALDRSADGSTTVALDTSRAVLTQLVPADTVTLDASAARGSVADPAPGTSKPVTVSGLVLGGVDAVNYTLLQPVIDPASPVVEGLSVSIFPNVWVPTPSVPPVSPVLSAEQIRFEEVRFKQYLQGVADAQEPFRRAMAEALASGFGKENIRKQLTRGLVFETGLAAPAIDRIEPTAGASTCVAVKGLECHRR
jgi:filamentous hemagglutinin family protein